MAISVADNFSYKGSKPLDARFQYSSVANMKDATTSDLYDGCLCYVTANKTYYTYDSSNTVDPTTGKWRELSTGGGSTVSVTQIQSTGTKIATIDVDGTETDLYAPIPDVDYSNMGAEAFQLSASEKVIGTWVDGKPLYQKTLNIGHLPANTSGGDYPHGISNLDTVVSIAGSARNDTGSNAVCIGLSYVDPSGVEKAISFYVLGANVHVMNGMDRGDWTAYITIQYTKTTDSAIASGEKIVGQWIDGSPLYKKHGTFTFADRITDSAGQVYWRLNNLLGLTNCVVHKIEGTQNTLYDGYWTGPIDLFAKLNLIANSDEKSTQISYYYTGLIANVVGTGTTDIKLEIDVYYTKTSA